jgi:hypothetical protein
MNVGFVETMRGTLRAADGSESNVEFEVHAHAEHLRKFLKDGQTKLRGIMRAAPYAVEVPATGELTIDLPRSLTYLVTFAANGVAYRLEGKKTPSLLSPIRSMTVMEVVLKTEDGKELARGEMTFALRELGGFIASWLPFNIKQRVSLDVRRRLLERGAMTK